MNWVDKTVFALLVCGFLALLTVWLLGYITIKED